MTGPPSPLTRGLDPALFSVQKKISLQTYYAYMFRLYSYFTICEKKYKIDVCVGLSYQINLLTSFALLNHVSLAEYRLGKFDLVKHFVLHLLHEDQEHKFFS